MRFYEKGMLINIIESRLIESYSEYSPQGQFNGIFVSYLYRFLRDNTYSGEHYNLRKELEDKLLPIEPNLIIDEEADNQTFSVTNTEDVISTTVLEALNMIIKKYPNYDFIVKSDYQIVFKVKFGWLPTNAGSWLNLINNDNLIDYYIDDVTLRPNTHQKHGGAPDSGYVCYRINDVREKDTILFLINKALTFSDTDEITVASLLTELEGTKGATLNQIKIFKPVDNFYYELGAYKDSYLTASKSSLIIQIPYDKAISDYLYVFDVSNAVIIDNKNNPKKPNADINYAVPFDLGYNKISSSNVIDYYIDNNELKQNTYDNDDSIPDSGYVCYRIDLTKYTTILTYAITNKITLDDNEYITFAVLTENSETKLSQIIKTKDTDAYYSNIDSASYIIQVPYSKLEEFNTYFNFFNVTGLFSFNDGYTYTRLYAITPEKVRYNYLDESKIQSLVLGKLISPYFIENSVNKTTIDRIINENVDILSDNLVQYILGDFIWKTADYKLITYAQNLINKLYEKANLTPNGVWSDRLSEYIIDFKKNNSNSDTLYIDDVLDKATEEIMTTMYKRALNNADPNFLFSEW